MKSTQETDMVLYMSGQIRVMGDRMLLFHLGTDRRTSIGKPGMQIPGLSEFRISMLSEVHNKNHRCWQEAGLSGGALGRYHSGMAC